MLAHHTSNGCDLRPGDVFGTGTISGFGDGEQGCLLEITANGQRAVTLPGGTERRFLEDGDEVILTARCTGDGFVPIGFGSCRGVVLRAA
jgi:fumarylacetoacetase